MLEAAFENLFLQIGEDPNRVGLKKTPSRMAEMYHSFLTGYQEDPDHLLGPPIPLQEPSSHHLISVPNIPFFSLCEHHLVPFFGKVTLVYHPSSSILGIGRIYQYIAAASRKLILQENLCLELAKQLYKSTQAKALLLKMSAVHTCTALSKKTTETAELECQSLLGNKDLFLSLKQELNEIPKR